jgi:hypothetical protein
MFLFKKMAKFFRENIPLRLKSTGEEGKNRKYPAPPKTAILGSPCWILVQTCPVNEFRTKAVNGIR